MKFNLRVSIARFVDEHFPGFVECEISDVDGVRYLIEDKVPIFTTENLWSDSTYPAEGTVGCEILERMTDDHGNEIVRVKLDDALLRTSFGRNDPVITVNASQLIS